MSKEAKLLELAAEIVFTSHGKQWLATTVDGRHVNPDSPKAVNFCIAGALIKASYELDIYLEERLPVVDHLLELKDSLSYTDWNDLDTTTNEDAAMLLLNVRYANYE